ncbi:MAG: hypothetical protein ABF289_15735 [Clostridiales bacterium]
MNLCYGCMNKKEFISQTCEICGYSDNSQENIPYILKPGNKLNDERYELGKVINSGEIESVYIAYDHKNNEKVCIKEYLPKEIIKRDDGNVIVLKKHDEKVYSEFLENIREDLKILKSNENLKNTIKVKDYFEDNNTIYTVIEYVDITKTTKINNDELDFKENQTVTFYQDNESSDKNNIINPKNNMNYPLDSNLIKKNNFKNKFKKTFLEGKRKIVFLFMCVCILSVILLGASYFYDLLSASLKLEDINKKIEKSKYNEAYLAYSDYIEENEFYKYDKIAKEKIEFLEKKAKDDFYKEAKKEVPKEYTGSFEKINKFCKNYKKNYAYSKELSDRSKEILDLTGKIEKNNKEIKNFNTKKNFYKENKEAVDKIENHIKEISMLISNAEIIFQEIVVSQNENRGISYAKIYKPFEYIDNYLTNNLDELHKMKNDMEKNKNKVITNKYFTLKEYENYENFIDNGTEFVFSINNLVNSINAENKKDANEDFNSAKNYYRKLEDIGSDIDKLIDNKKGAINKIEISISNNISENKKYLEKIKKLTEQE